VWKYLHYLGLVTYPKFHDKPMRFVPAQPAGQSSWVAEAAWRDPGKVWQNRQPLHQVIVASPWFKSKH